MADYADQRVTVMGLGRFGGGLGVTRFLAERGARVLVTDTLPAEQLRDSVAALRDLVEAGQLRLRLGEHREADFADADLVVVNPAVRPGNPYVEAAKAAGVAVTSEIRLLVKHLPNRQKTIGITGSAGKSTTTAMIGHVLGKEWQSGDSTPSRQGAKTPRKAEEPVDGPGVWVGGNLGGSLLPVVDQIRHEDWVVLELSSFMLEGLREDRWSPHIAVLTNLSPNHLDWHGSMEAYVAAKRVVFEFQERGDVAIREPLPGRWDLRLPGGHNQLNAGLAAAACRAAGVEVEGRLADFPGLPHRLEYVGEFQGVACYNDSKSTTPEAAMLAIDSFPDRQVHLILGGYDKGSDFGELAQRAAAGCAGVYTIGATGDRIAGLVEAAAGLREGGGIPDASVAPPDEPPSASASGSRSASGLEFPGVVVQRCGTLEVAVRRAIPDASVAKPPSASASAAGAAGGQGGVLVLSPGCASWDQFANYEARGARFVELVRGWGESQKQKPTV